ncbi:MAG: hypothetical protein ABI543_15730 [Ignavibacteria bacterium]
MKVLLIILFAGILFAGNAYSQDLSITIYYLLGEKSKDSHSMDESFAISNTSVAYSVKYSGHKGKGQEDIDKTCTFSEQDLKNIRKTIEEKNLNVTDSLLQTTSKTKSYEVYTRVNIAIAMDGKEYKITISGDTLEFKEETLYKNSVYFITMLRKMVVDCK